MKKQTLIILSIILLLSFDLHSQNRSNWIDISPYPVHLVGNGSGFVFFNQDTGYVYTEELINSVVQNCLYRTNDGGKNWFRKKIVFVSLYNCQFFNKNLGFYKLGVNVYKTIDGGDSFDIIKTFLYGNTGILYNSKNSIFANASNNSSHPDSMKTFIGKNFGSSWKLCYDTQIWEIKFVDSMNGYAIKTSKPPYLLKTINGGVTWNKTFKMPDNGGIVRGGKLNFVTIDTGYFVTTYNKLYKTTNAGLTWVSIMNGLHNTQCYDITCINSKTCFSVGYDLINKTTVIYKTTNAGQSWVSLSDGMHFTKSFNLIQYVMDSIKNVTIFISSVEGQHTPIYKATFYPEEIWDNIETPINSVSKFELYPNPSNRYINVNLKLDHVGDVSLKVIDALGKEIKNLKLNDFKEGMIPVDMSKYSGIFFFNIKTDKETVSKKVILAK